MSNKKFKISLSHTYDYPNWNPKNINSSTIQNRLDTFNQQFEVDLDEEIFLDVEQVFSLADQLVSESWDWLSLYWNSENIHQVISNYQQMCLNVMMDTRGC